MRKALVIVGGLLLVAGFVGGFVIADRVGAQPRAEERTTTPPRAEPAAMVVPAAAQAAGLLPNLSDVAEQAVRASVNISSTRYVRIDPFFQLFYGADPVQPQTSGGSGVVVSADGYILTNNHVIGNAADVIRVTLADNREFDAEVVGVDEITDLAVLKISVTGLQPLPWADSSKLRVAEWVLAVGNPFSLSQTVTLGIVSAVNRPDPMSIRGFIQTDAAINPGNSGGALVNVRGELVGINTMIYTETGGYQGIGFAVPSGTARTVMSELIKSGEVVRGSIGNVTFRPVDPETARRADLVAVRGARIEQMYRSDPAFRAGLLPDDIVMRFNDQDVQDVRHLLQLISEAPIGSTATIDAVRWLPDQRRLRVEVPVVRMRPLRRRF
ncbi:MAG TPA: trypsin-like peptidase domain-containing protein [Vicinamibacterales bacterium]|nr:trypsin-like peptidase domain-containing protein [Vicinamibacterales bacterium]